MPSRFEARFRPQLTRLEDRETPAVAYALAGGNLLAIDVLSSGMKTTPVALTGIGAGESLVGIDVRPADTQLYGLTTTGSAVRLYRINPHSGVATALTVNTLQFDDGTNPVPITGTNFGIDFNPVSDSLRVVTNTGFNFRVNPNTGQLIDGDNNSLTPVAGLNPDGNISGGVVSGAAYTNGSAGATVTTLYTLDATDNKLFIQNSPVSGTQTAGQLITLGGTPLDFTAINGFDLPPGVKVTAANATATGKGYVVLTVGSSTDLYSIELGTGALTLIGSFGNVSISGFTLVGGGIQVYGADVGAGLVNVYNSDGSGRFSFLPYEATWTGGVRVAAADVNGDGIEDIITAAGPGGGPHVKVYDGLSGQIIRSFYAYAANYSLGISLGAADVNGDGYADIIAGAGPGGGPHVLVYSGLDLTTLASFYAYDPRFTGGISVAGGDLNGDGLAEVITGAGPGGGPHVQAFQVFTRVSDVVTPTLTTVASFFAYGTPFSEGVFVAYATRGDTPLIVTGTGKGAAPLVGVFDKNGALLSSFFAYDQSFTGGVRVGSIAGTILTAAGPGGGPHAKAYNSTTLALEGSSFVFDAAFSGGVFVS